MKAKQIPITVLKGLAFSIISFVYLLFSPGKYIFTGKSIIGRVLSILGYTGLVVSFIFNFKIALGILVGIYILATLIVFPEIISSSRSEKKKVKDMNMKETEMSELETDGNYFEGMNKKDALDVLENTLKLCKPENGKGDFDALVQIVKEYNEHCEKSGCC